MTRLVPLLSARPRATQAFLVVGGPVIAGIICGVLLGTNESAYLIASILALAGGYLAGYEHPSPGEGALRGAVGGTLFGTFILLTHVVDTREATNDLPDPEILLVVFTAVFGIFTGILGGFMRRRAEASAPVV